MIIDLTRFINGTEQTYHFEDKIESDRFSYGSGTFKIIPPVSYIGEVYKVYGSCLIHIDIYYKYKTQCDRCLKSTTGELKTILSGKLVEGKDETFYGEDNLLDEEGYEDTIYYENDQLDLEEHILNQVMASLPMKSICNDDCKGLCLQCGINLNDESCDCDNDIIDPRLEVLKNLFSKK